MRFRAVNFALLLAAILAASTSDANAYVGPGSGLSAIGSLISVVSAMLLAVAGFVWYPLKRLLKRTKPTLRKSAAGAPAEAAKE